MSLPVSSRVEHLRASPTVAISSLAAELAANGRDIVRLSAGEPDFPTPAHISDAAIEAIRQGQTRYTPVGGTLELREAIRKKFRQDNELDYGINEIMASTGGKELCYLTCQAVLNPGDEAIVIAPYWVSYPAMIELFGGTVRTAMSTYDTGFKLTPATLRQNLSDRTRLIFLNSPCNPTGAVYSADELVALGEELTNYPKVVIVSDEIYEKVCWGEQASLSIASLCPQLKDRTLTLNGVSKAYAMTGWRLGYAGGPATLIGRLKKLQGQSTTHPCSISQAASVAALEGDQSFLEPASEQYQLRQKILLDGLDTLPGLQMIPAAGAFYGFVDARQFIDQHSLGNDVALCEALLEHAGVALVPGSAFGVAGFVRISFACDPSQLRDALERIRQFSLRS